MAVGVACVGGMTLLLRNDEKKDPGSDLGTRTRRQATDDSLCAVNAGEKDNKRSENSTEFIRHDDGSYLL